MRRGHVAPQNTFLDTIIRKFEGQSEWGKGSGRGLRGGPGPPTHPECRLGGVPAVTTKSPVTRGWLGSWRCWPGVAQEGGQAGVSSGFLDRAVCDSELCGDPQLWVGWVGVQGWWR